MYLIARLIMNLTQVVSIGIVRMALLVIQATGAKSVPVNGDVIAVVASVNGAVLLHLRQYNAIQTSTAI